MVFLKDVLLSEYRNIGKYSIDYNPVKLKRQEFIF